jgi:hypothetical protein
MNAAAAPDDFSQPLPTVEEIAADLSQRLLDLDAARIGQDPLPSSRTVRRIDTQKPITGSSAVSSNGNGKPAEMSGGQGSKSKPANDFIRDAKALRKVLDDGLKRIDELDDVATRSAALVKLQASIGLNRTEFLALVKQLAEVNAPKPAESFEELMAAPDDDCNPVIDDLLAPGLTLIAAEGFAGKSSTAYQIAEAVTLGDRFAGQFQCQQSSVLVVQMDESPKDARVKWRRMGLNPAPGRLHIKWHFTPMMFPELRKWVSETTAKAVVLDSLMMIAGGEINPKDAEFGLLIYRLNQLASELGISIICLHHVVKASRDKSRVGIIKEDIFGTAYVFNGAADVFGLWRYQQEGSTVPYFALRCFKARSGLVEVGTTYEFQGNDEDHRLRFMGIAGRTQTLDDARSARQRIVTHLRARPGQRFAAENVASALGIGSNAYAAKLLTALYSDRARSGIEREQIPPGPRGGRPLYCYFAAA